MNNRIDNIGSFDIENQLNNQENTQNEKFIIQQKNTELLKKENDWNTYSTKKSYGEGYLNTESVLINITLLVSIYWSRWITSIALNPFQVALIVLLIISLTFRICLYIFLAILANSKTEYILPWLSATTLNNLVTSMAGIMVFITSAISVVKLKTDIDISGNVSIT